MNLELEGRRALVTGSSAGLGAEIVERLAAEGAAVVVHGRDEVRAEAVAKAVRGAGGSATVAIGDIGTDTGADAVAAAALAGGPVDILVNNAGVYDPAADWGGTPSSAWADIYNINVIAGVRMIQRLVPAMRERRWGRVIQISSVTGHLPQASQPHYAASNAARDNLAASLARELAHTGVTSNAVAAGGILVPATRRMLTDLGREKGWGDTWDEIEPHVVDNLAPNDSGRIGRPGDYARLVAFVAGAGAGYINGTTLRVDGGWRDA
ncbi:SDR family NAD(P)-dependent oxidoreductase [Streptomyces sp. NBC_00178]|uniref:SDR family NAD(P)-dependent oxidoreductase n=1 Tax=Streptomyces sp. NBC_00178 TaxID=2975672 RepID=UPI002E2DAF92|nr:SDR family NAD(P)-dependent oxidoreductase [Streptomyces sp. NBC_00178]